MMEQQNLKINNIPLLLCYNNSLEIAVAKGTVLVCHGLFSRKEDNAKELTSLADAGFLAIGIDAPRHGERRDAQLENDMKDRENNVFTELLTSAVTEYNDLLYQLENKQLIKNEKVGITGISMGGYIAYAMALHPMIKAAVPILASPVFSRDLPESPHHHYKSFSPTPLLALNARLDQSVPPHHSREFIEKLRPCYQSVPTHLDYIEYPNSGHFMEEDEWNDLWQRTVGWFQLFL
jgi:hypothetical protein